MTILALCLLGLAAFLWFGMLAESMSLRKRDHATRGLSELLCMALVVVIWVLIGVVLLISRSKAPITGGLAAVLLLPVSAASSIAAIRILGRDWGRDGKKHLRWVALTPAAAPLLMASHSVCMILPDLFRGTSSWAWAVWGGVAAVSILPWIAMAIGRRMRAE